jgi:hypothetical protein
MRVTSLLALFLLSMRVRVLLVDKVCKANVQKTSDLITVKDSLKSN